MKSLLLFVFLAFLFSYKTVRNNSEVSEEISLKEDVTFLTSDELEG